MKRRCKPAAEDVPLAGGYTRTVQCSQCPWRKDVAPGRFPPERFVSLRNTVDQHLWHGNPLEQPVFACHKSTKERPQACVGFLLVDGPSENIAVRYALMTKRYDPKSLVAKGPLYASFAEMAKANGVS